MFDHVVSSGEENYHLKRHMSIFCLRLNEETEGSLP
jgi:hypothetical protein